MLEFIFSLALGLLFGNYSTSFYSRILQKKPINGMFKKGIKPHCDSCQHDLRYYEYFPVLSWIFCKFKCNYCNVEIPRIYCVLECIGMISAGVLWMICGFSPMYIIWLLCILSLVLVSAITFYRLD